MMNATIILWIVTVVLAIYAWRRNDGSLKSGLILGWKTFKRNLLLLLIGFTLVGFVNMLSPTQLIQDLIGPESGFRGIMLAEVIGMVLPGGPYAVFPIIEILYREGAGLASVITIITSWATLGLISVSFELPIMGWRFSAIRWGLGLVIPFMAGTAALIFFT